MVKLIWPLTGLLAVFALLIRTSPKQVRLFFGGGLLSLATGAALEYLFRPGPLGTWVFWSPARLFAPLGGTDAFWLLYYFVTGFWFFRRMPELPTMRPQFAGYYAVHYALIEFGFKLGGYIEASWIFIPVFFVAHFARYLALVAAYDTLGFAAQARSLPQKRNLLVRFLLQRQSWAYTWPVVGSTVFLWIRTLDWFSSRPSPAVLRGKPND